MNLKYSYLIILAVTLLFLNACNEPAPKTETPVVEQKEFPAFFQKVLDAHGGLETWNKMNTLKFSSTRKVPTTNYSIDLKSRKEIIEAEGKYTLGNDGKTVWVSPARDSFPGKNPRFMKNLTFYFVAIPFVLADNGVNLEDLGSKEVNYRKYNVIKVTFGEGVGDASEDQYVLYVNPNTNKIDFINYSVTYFDKTKATKYNALKYEWQNVNGLLFPEKYIGYKWENEQLGEIRYESPFEKVSFSEEKMNDSTFLIPEGAWVEN